MNGFGIGLTVAVGILIAFAIGAPDFPRDEMIMTVVFWGFMSGLIFEMYRLALFRKPTR
jgi:hypothetical protein